uniref:Uncharacterized protein n=1 Tax=viral metagenome TaxID=1070528 RepID=A0A6M3IL20_9ZZZZ
MPEGFVGTFTVNISAEQLKRGLRPSKRSPRNTGYLVECLGAVGQDGVMQALALLSRLNTSVITDTFPFPQIFVCVHFIIVCSATKIYEFDGTILTLKYTAATAAGTWVIADFYDYIYLSNGSIAVIRDAGSKAYSLTTALPSATAICNFNGQVIIGASDTDGLVANLKMPVGILGVTLTQLGTLTLNS